MTEETEKRLRILQVLCPLRHAIIAGTYEAAERDPGFTEKVRGILESAFRNGILNPRCELCGAPAEKWTYEDKRTRFRTQEEAAPFLAASEEAQRRTREMLSAREAGKN